MFLLVPAYPGSPGPMAIKRLCVCVCGSKHITLVCNLRILNGENVATEVGWPRQ